jgi:hypothetical protein
MDSKHRRSSERTQEVVGARLGELILHAESIATRNSPAARSEHNDESAAPHAGSSTSDNWAPRKHQQQRNAKHKQTQKRTWSVQAPSSTPKREAKHSMLSLPNFSSAVSCV